MGLLTFKLISNQIYTSFLLELATFSTCCQWVPTDTQDNTSAQEGLLVSTVLEHELQLTKVTRDIDIRIAGEHEKQFTVELSVVVIAVCSDHVEQYNIFLNGEWEEHMEKKNLTISSSYICYNICIVVLKLVCVSVIGG